MSYCKRLLCMFCLCCLLLPVSGVAQSQNIGLVISEVHFDSTNIENSWIEVYNPSKHRLALGALVYNHVLSPNLLPVEVKKKGGIGISPGKLVVISSSRKNDFNKKTNVIVAPGLKMFGPGGYCAIFTKDTGDMVLSDCFRYGDLALSTRFSVYTNNIVSYSNGIYSYTKNNPNQRNNKFTIMTSSPGSI